MGLPTVREPATTPQMHGYRGATVDPCLAEAGVFDGAVKIAVLPDVESQALSGRPPGAHHRGTRRPWTHRPVVRRFVERRIVVAEVLPKLTAAVNLLLH